MWWTAISWVLGKLPGVVDSVGDKVIKYHDTTAKMQADQNASGTTLSAKWLDNVTETNKIKAQMRHDEGVWGPMGMLMFYVGLAFCSHAWAIVLDSMPLPYIALHLNDWFMPYATLHTHDIGTWKIAALPAPFDDAEISVIKSLFPITGAVVGVATLAKAFRR